MNIDRINHGIDILKKIHRENKPFDLSDWIFLSKETPKVDFDPNIPIACNFAAIAAGMSDSKQNHFCNTAACAVGYFSLDPEFQAAGLKPSIAWEEEDFQGLRCFKREIVSSLEELIDIRNDLIIKGVKRKDIYTGIVFIDGPDDEYDAFPKIGYSAVSQFFGISYVDALMIFGLQGYSKNPGPLDVAAKLEALIFKA